MDWTWGGGLNRYDPSTNKFTRYSNNPNDLLSLSDGTITSIKPYSQGSLWVATLGGLDKYNPGTNGFEHYRNDRNNSNSFSSNIISTIFEDSQGQLWIGTGANGINGSVLNCFDPATGKVTRYQHDKADPESIASNNVAAIVEAPDGVLWIATGGFSLRGDGLDQFYPRTGKAKHFKYDPQNEPPAVPQSNWVPNVRHQDQ